MQHKSLLDIKIDLTTHEFIQFLTDQGDIFWWEEGKFWVITSHQYAKEILTSDDYSCDRSPFFISRMPNLDLPLIKDFFAVVSKMMVMSDGETHSARRRICYDGFTNQTLDIMQPLITRTVQKQLDACAASGRMELVQDLATILPSTVLAEFFHIPEAERPDFYRWSNNMTQFFGGASQYRNEDGIEVNESANNLYHYFYHLIQERRKTPAGDFLSILLKHQSAFGLTDDEIISQSIMMLVAGQITTTDQICNNMYTLLSNDATVRAFQSGEIDTNNAINELNRLDPAVTFLFRVTKRDTQIGTQTIKAGDVIFISTHAVNRDPRVFNDPDVCLLDRKSNQLGYGFGPHFCMGSKLAQLEMKICFEMLFKRYNSLRLVSENPPKRKHHSLAFSGFEYLPLVLE